MPVTPTSLKRLYLIQVATLPPINAPVVCYLVQTDDDRNILIDTGTGADYAGLPGMPPPINHPNVVEQLAQIGLQPADISMLICTHFDPDHSGHHDEFPNAEFVVQRKHYEVAQTQTYPRLQIARHHWDQPQLRYRFVDGDTELVPGLKLLATDGHVFGHQSVLLHLPETGAVLLAIDAVVRKSLFTADRPATPMDEDAEAVRVSARKLIQIAEQEHVALVIFGHDQDQWPTLKKLPDFYG